MFKITHPDCDDLGISPEGVAAAGDETTDGPRVVLSEYVQKLPQQRQAFGQFGTPPR